MDLSNIDNLMYAAGIAGHVVLLFVLFKQRLHREFPIFTAYMVFVLLADPVMLLVMQAFHVPSLEMASSPIYFRVYSALQVPEYLLDLGVLFEIARSVLKPVKRSLPAGALGLFGALLAGGAVVTYFFTAHMDMGTKLTILGGVFVKIILTMAVLRIACFVVIAIFAQMLGIGWKNHVLQLATGLAFYGAVELIVRFAHAEIGSRGSLSVYHSQFRWLDELRVISYLSTLAFWSWSFARQEAPRREFSPQMERFLVSISGAAKRDRSQFGR